MRSDRYVRLLNRLVDAARSPRLRRSRAHRRGASALPELVAPVSSARARRLASRLAALQDVLGDHHDLVVARAWLADAARETERPLVAFVAGELAGVMRARQDDLRRRWPRVWPALDTK